MMKTNKNIVVAIDGPAASGKSTIAQIVAQRLNFLYVDSGAMYRAFTWKVIRDNINIDNPKELDDLINNTNLVLKKDTPIKVYIDNIDITAEIREPKIDQNISKIAKNGSIREALVNLQRSYQKDENLIMDGRDIGTVVFPWANFKFYLDANLEVRANRRFKELIDRGKKVTPGEIIKEMKYRDQEDFTRAIGPLRCAEDAFRINTSDLSIEQVASIVLDHICNYSV